jgi:hypothetical protein
MTLSFLKDDEAFLMENEASSMDDASLMDKTFPHCTTRL